MGKVDLRKTLGIYKAKNGQFSLIKVPKLQYLAIDGHGDPNTSKHFSDAVAALYPVAYKIKFISKIDLGKDYIVMPLEGLWWADNMDTFTSARDKSQWSWTLMILQPDWITNDIFEAALEKAAKKVPAAMLAELRLQKLSEGLCVQTLHVGSYDDETAILAEMHNNFIPNNRLKMVQKHHEIYLSDARKVAPGKLKTILRQPVEKS